MYSREGLRGVLREHCGHNPVHNFELCLVKPSHFNKDIFGVGRNLRVVAVDDRW